MNTSEEKTHGALSPTLQLHHESANITHQERSTDAAQRELQLNQLEFEMQQMQQLAHIGSWYWGVKTGDQVISREMLRIFGRESIPPFPEQRGVLYPIETWECLNVAFQEAVQSGIGYDLELPALRGDGTSIWINTRCIAERDVNGDICGLRGTMQDITQRRQSEERVQFQAKLLNAIGQAVVATDLQGTVTYMNGAAESLYGWPSTEAIGRNILEVTVPDVSQSQAIEIMGQLTAGHPWSGEFAVHHRDGGIFTAEVHDTPIVDASGKLIGVIGVSSDISLRKQTERLLAQSQVRYETVVTALSEGIVTLGRDGAIISCNPAAERILRLSGNQLRASKGFDPSWQATHEDGTPFPSESLPGPQVLRSGVPESNVVMGIVKADGVQTWVSVNAMPIFNPGESSPEFAVVSFTDITERRRVVNELENARKLAEEASLAKSSFLSSMSHELRTPLNAILGFAQLLESGSTLPTVSQMGSINQILKAGWYLLELINEVLDLALIESGKLVMLREAVPLDSVMLECQALVEPLADQRGISMRFPVFDVPCFVDADRIRIKQALINLLSNAIKYNRPAGTVTIECTLVAPSSIRISVRDTGAGMTTEQLAQLFTSFNRLGKETSNEQGTGIGLVVTKRLVELMGGKIGVNSILGVGSVFWIELGLMASPQCTLVNSQPPLPAEPHPPGNTAHRIVLCVEDNSANLELVEEIMKRRPELRLLGASDGNLGVEYARTYLPEVILMDLNLPGISGIEAMRILQADPLVAHIPVIALSANAMQADISKALEAGFFNYITKPIRVSEFMAVVDLALESTNTKQTQPATNA
jgi:PAS domain S-box-containing protein